MKKTITINNEKKTINISRENSKLGMIPSFSVVAGTEGYCKQNCTKCYAKNLENLRSCVKECNQENYNFLEFIKNNNVDINDIVNQFTNIIDSLNCRIFRWNVSGDVDSKYMQLIINIARQLPYITFYMYTKNTHVIDKYIGNIVLTSNLIVNISIMHYSNSYLIDKYKNYSNIHFMITYRNNIDEYMFYKTSYNLKNVDYAYCVQDFPSTKNKACMDCKKCFNTCNKIVFNEYRNLKTISNHNLISINFLNLTVYNHFMDQALLEIYSMLVNHTYTNVLLIEKLMFEHKKNIIKLIKTSNTFYSAICKGLDYMCALIEKDYEDIRKDIYNSTIYKANKNVSDNVRLYDNNVDELKKDIEHYFDKQDIKTLNMFNCECFRISNIIFNTIDGYKYRYCNIRRIVFQEVNRLMNDYCKCGYFLQDQFNDLVNKL